MSYATAFNTPAYLAIAAPNASWQWLADISSASAATQTLEYGKWYTVINLAANTVCLGFGATAAAANTESASTKGRPVLTEKELTFCVTDKDKVILSATPDSGTSSLRVIAHTAP